MALETGPLVVIIILKPYDCRFRAQWLTVLYSRFHDSSDATWRTAAWCASLEESWTETILKGKISIILYPSQWISVPWALILVKTESRELGRFRDKEMDAVSRNEWEWWSVQIRECAIYKHCHHTFIGFTDPGRTTSIVSLKVGIKGNVWWFPQGNQIPRNWLEGSIRAKFFSTLIPWAPVASELPSNVTLDSSVQDGYSASGVLGQKDLEFESETSMQHIFWLWQMPPRDPLDAEFKAPPPWIYGCKVNIMAVKDLCYSQMVCDLFFPSNV